MTGENSGKNQPSQDFVTRKSSVFDSLQFIRIEEWLVLVLLALGASLCWSSETGFYPSYGFWTHVRFLAPGLVVLFLISRLALLVPDSLLQRTRPTRALAAFIDVDARDILKLDFNVLRSCVLLLAAISVYANLVVRVPFVRDTSHDAFFSALSGGDGPAMVLTSMAAKSAPMQQALEVVFWYGPWFFIGLFAFLYIQRRLFCLRWLLASVVITCVLGALLSVLFPSLGPAFVDPQRFAWFHGSSVHQLQQGLMHTLNQSIDLASQGATIAPYPATITLHDGGIYLRQPGGIASFPSLRIAIMIVFIVVAARTFPRYAMAMGLVMVLTFLTTVSLGFHYLIDVTVGAGLGFGVVIGTYYLMRWGESSGG